MTVLTGTCNRCGLCCVIEGFRCLNLVGPKPLNPVLQGGPTTCAVYDKRYDKMPIILVNDEGLMVRGTCGKDSPAETRAIIERGIGQGCSLELIKEGESEDRDFVC